VLLGIAIHQIELTVNLIQTMSFVHQSDRVMKEPIPMPTCIPNPNAYNKNNEAALNYAEGRCPGNHPL